MNADKRFDLGDETHQEHSIVEKERAEIRPGPSLPFFSFMMVNFMANQKINTFIGECYDPFSKVVYHNEGRAGTSKTTRSAAPHWKLNMIIGEFRTEKEAQDFSKDWRVKSRGILSRRGRGKDLARTSNVLICWFDE